jgi:ribosomal-protein-alanine N-acetyltransferase
MCPQCFRIREAIIDDVPKILKIENICNPDPWSRDVFREEIDSFGAFSAVGFESEKIGGFICSRIIFDELHIHNLAVHPTCRRKGLASKLLDFTFEMARSKMVVKAFLEVRQTNQPAIVLYQKFGFSTDYIRKNYYSDGENALVMSADVTSTDDYN